MFAESGLGSSARLLITFVKHGFGVGFFGEQDVVQDARDFVCRGGDRLRGTKLRAHPAEELTEVALGATQRVGSEPESDGGSILHLSGLAGQDLGTADPFLGAEAQPRRKRRGVTKAADIRADLGEDDLGGDGTDSGNIGEVDPSDAIELTAEIETGTVALTLKSRVFGAARKGLGTTRGARQKLHEALDLAVQLGDQLLVIPVAIQGLLQGAQMSGR